MGEGGVWVSDTRENAVRRLDAETGKREGEPVAVPTGDNDEADPGDDVPDAEAGPLVLGGGAVWVGTAVGPTVGRIPD